jgi:hypothetical protein
LIHVATSPHAQKGALRRLISLRQPLIATAINPSHMATAPMAKMARPSTSRLSLEENGKLPWMPGPERDPASDHRAAHDHRKREDILRDMQRLRRVG